jgi:hypothetical protein
MRSIVFVLDWFRGVIVELFRALLRVPRTYRGPAPTQP